MNFITFTTCDLGGDRLDNLFQMIASMNDFSSRNPEVTIQAHLLMQCCSAIELDDLRKKIPDYFVVSAIEGRVSLSKARNIMLSTVEGDDLSRSVVAFPDDDCWYPYQNLDTILAEFSSDPQLDMFFCRYASKPEILSLNFDRQLSPGIFSVVSSVCSITMFMRGDLVAKVGGFDETLGVGAKFNGGEDTDFALKIFSLSKKVVFADGAYICHRDRDVTRRGIYYPGGLLAIANSARKVSGGWLLFAKKIAVGLALVLRRELALRRYLEVLALGFRRFLA